MYVPSFNTTLKFQELYEYVQHTASKMNVLKKPYHRNVDGLQQNEVLIIGGFSCLFYVYVVALLCKSFIEEQVNNSGAGCTFLCAIFDCDSFRYRGLH